MNSPNKIFKEICKQIIKNTIAFRKIIRKNWVLVTNEIMEKTTKEYLNFLMYCAIFVMQNNDLSNEKLDEFHKIFYQQATRKGLLEKDILLDYEKLSRERYMDFYQTLSSEKRGQSASERLNALVTKEALFIQKLLPGSGEKENALGELYAELFSGYSGLTLQVQLMATYCNKQE